MEALRHSRCHPVNMRLPFLRPKESGPTEHPVLSDVVEPVGVREARTRARQRLTGALVLLVLGVLLFPLLFETQPRPLGVDAAVVTTARDNINAAAVGTTTALPLPVASAPARAAAVAEPAPVVSPGPPVPTTAVRPALAPAVLPVPVSVPAPAATPSAPRAVESAPAQPAQLRFVVQAGAYGEATALRDARQKVEKLGLKTFIQVIDNGSGKRTRVRVGPFATRQEAEAVAAKVKGAGLQANVLAL